MFETIIKVIPLTAFTDNYIWLIMDEVSQQAIIVDPGDAEPVLKTLAKLNIQLLAIFVTHHHWDHSRGIQELLQHYSVPVYGPANETIAGVNRLLKENDAINLSTSLHFQVLEIPGHTSGHIAYYGHKALFCGDTLFGAGCGRLFEGTAEQMFTSLTKLSHLPDDTLIYCGHEYTLANLQFAQHIEPNNNAIKARIDHVAALCRQNLPTLPSTIQAEKLTNPFLRCFEPDVIQAAKNYSSQPIKNPVDVFSILRDWKNNFKQ